MFAWKTSDWGAAAAGKAADPTLDARTSGLVAGTKVATPAGWSAVENLQIGNEVLTFDGGMQTLIGLTRKVFAVASDDAASLPMFVPAGALGNLEDMTMLPHQPVMIESDLAEEMTGDPFALIPAAALDGIRGIAVAVRPQDMLEVIQLHFAQDEIVFANIGALFLCRAQADLFSDLQGTQYDVLAMDIAFDLADCLMEQEAVCAAGPVSAPCIAAV